MQSQGPNQLHNPSPCRRQASSQSLLCAPHSCLRRRQVSHWFPRARSTQGTETDKGPTHWAGAHSGMRKSCDWIPRQEHCWWVTQIALPAVLELHSTEEFKKKKLSALAGIKSFLSVRKTQKCSPCYHHWAFIKAPLHYYRTPPLSVEQKGKQWNGSTLHKHLSQTLKRQQRGEREIIHPHCFVSPSLFPQGQLPFSQNTAVKPSWKQFLQANVDTSCSNKVRHDIVLLSSYEKALEKEKGKQNE